MSTKLTRGDLAAIFGERAGIREFDGGAARVVAEVGAYWDTMAEALRRGTDKAGADYLERLGYVVHLELDQKMAGLLQAAEKAA